MRCATALAVPFYRLSRSISTPAMFAQLTHEMCVIAENCKNTLKAPILGVQGHSRSSLLTLKSSLLVLVMTSSMSVSMCNCFHAKGANIVKLTTF